MIDYRWGGVDIDRMRIFATELVGLRPDVLFAGNTTTLAALQRATRDIPIVFTLVADPIAGGFSAWCSLREVVPFVFEPRTNAWRG